jgi:hypothetical protein
MVLALGAGQHLLDVIEAANETRAQIEAFRPKLIRAAPRPSESVKTCPENVVDDRLERHPPLAPLAFESHGHVIIEGQSGSHTLMLTI